MTCDMHVYQFCLKKTAIESETTTQCPRSSEKDTLHPKQCFGPLKSWNQFFFLILFGNSSFVFCTNISETDIVWSIHESFYDVKLKNFMALGTALKIQITSIFRWYLINLCTHVFVDWGGRYMGVIYLCWNTLILHNADNCN